MKNHESTGVMVRSIWCDTYLLVQGLLVDGAVVDVDREEDTAWYLLTDNSLPFTDATADCQKRVPNV
jgi:hypothetical protein